MLQNSFFATPGMDIVCPGSLRGGHIGSSLWVVTAKGPEAYSFFISRNGLGLFHDFGEHITGESRVEIAAGTIAPEDVGSVIIYRGQVILCPHRDCPVVVVAFETECEVEIGGHRYVMVKTSENERIKRPQLQHLG